MPVDFAGNNLNNATTLNITSNPNNISDWVGNDDFDDYYKIRLNSRASLNLALNGLSANADLQLLNNSGSVIAAGNKSRREAESITTTLDAGIYYIRVYQVDGGNTYYNLNIFGNQAPYSLQFATNKTTYQTGETVSLTDTKVFDVDGINDLARVDFWLQKDNGVWQNIANTVNFSENSSPNFNYNLTGIGGGKNQLRSPSNNYYSFNYNLTGLSTGNYRLWAQAYDKSGASASGVETSFNVASTGDWFDQNIQDAGIRAASKSYFADKILDRNDMIAVLRDAKDGGVVDAIEIADLNKIINNASNLGMPDYVKVLANKVVNGDIANQQYQNSPLGNLVSGSSDIKMEKLISKWFFGSDRPATSYTYQYASGSLFKNGINYQDIKQGYINDCYFLAGLAATAFRSSSTIESMFIDNGDNTFSVRFYNNGIADYVTVDRYLPTDSTGYFTYASVDTDHKVSTNELWVSLAEKAYAQINESGWINQNNTNTYSGIGNGGYMSNGFAQVSGRSTTYGNLLNSTSIINAFDSGKLIGLGTKPTVMTSNIVPGHAYVLVGYNSSSQKFSLFNPWGIDNNLSKPGMLELSWSDIEANFAYWDSTLT